VDEAAGKVYGRAVQEVKDLSGEIFDYASSKPNFAKWSEDFAKVTDGKSVGNVRAMHGKVAAGKLTEITFNDAEKAIDVCAEIVDPVEREKCLKGIYTGFSIGGRYEKKWADEVDKAATRYTAQPSEISLVDLPCVPTAQFTVIKSDGSEELRKFETTMDDEALAKWVEGQSDDVRERIAKIAQRKDVSAKEGEHKYGDVKFADEKNKKYPIDTPEHIRAAWNYIHKGENADKYSAEDAAKIKACIVAAWRDKIDPKGPPEAEKTVSITNDALALLKDTYAGGLQKLKDGAAIPADDPVEKVGRKHTKATRAHLAAIREHLDAMQADDPASAGDDEAAEKVTEAELQKRADELVKVQGDLAKVTGERDELQKGLDEIKAEVERIKALPAQPKGPLRAVEKGQDNDALSKDTPVDEKPVMKADGTIDHMATAEKSMKAALSKRA
jgi:hypothetical protein